MKGRIRQRSPGSSHISYELGRNAPGKHRTKAITVRGNQSRCPSHLLREREPVCLNPGA